MFLAICTSTLHCLMCCFLIRLSDLLNVDLMLPFFTVMKTCKSTTCLLSSFLFLVSLHVICKDWQLSSSVAAQSDTCD